MPSHQSYYSHSFAKGVKKLQVTSSTSSLSYKTFFNVFQKKNHCPAPVSGFLPQGWFATAPTTSAPIVPTSKEFESHDCIWYYGTLYVKEAVAVTKIDEIKETQKQSFAEPVSEPAKHSLNNDNNDDNEHDDDDTESVCSSHSNGHSHHHINGSNLNNATKHPRSIGKQNQLKYLKDGMRLRHVVSLDEWVATFDAGTNRIIRTSDGVAFDTLRQFARLHCNEVDSSFTSINVWSDTHFHYQDDVDGQWYPLANLKH
jgi:hypothetical protein